MHNSTNSINFATPRQRRDGLCRTLWMAQQPMFNHLSNIGEYYIQLADVFASALCFALTPREDKFVKYQDKIKSLPIFQNIKLNIAPSTNDFIEERMKETAEIDPLDFLCKHNIDISTEQN